MNEFKLVDVKEGKDGTYKNYVFQYDAMKVADFSRLKDKKITHENIDCEEMRETAKYINNKMNDFMKEYVKRHDEAIVLSMLKKAALYDAEFNPYTVTEHEKHEAVKNFCLWVVNKINNNKLTKKEIIELLKSYSNV